MVMEDVVSEVTQSEVTSLGVDAISEVSFTIALRRLPLTMHMHIACTISRNSCISCMLKSCVKVWNNRHCFSSLELQ